jgi:flagellar biosynthesis protein FlhF
MESKTFEAPTLEEALTAMRRELGPDAIVIETKNKKLGFGLLNKTSVEVRASVPLRGGGVASSRIISRKSELEDYMATLLSRLIRSGVSEKNTKMIVDGLIPFFKEGKLRSETEILSKMAERIRTFIKVAPSLAERVSVGKNPKVVTFVGPTGVGKTTTLAKVAAELLKVKKVRIILATMDTYKVGAVEHLESYARYLSLPFAVCRSPAESYDLIQKLRPDDILFLDTLGAGPKENTKLSEMSLLFSRVEAETHLCVSVTTQERDMRDIMSRFSLFRPNYLLATKLDESYSLGEFFNAYLTQPMPLSYLTVGQRVPQDLEPARKEVFVERLLGLF